MRPASRQERAMTDVPRDPLGQDGRRRLHRLPGPRRRARHAPRRPRLGLAPRGLLGAAALRALPAAAVAEHARPRLRQARDRHVGPRAAARPTSACLADDVRAVMDAAGVERAALLGWGGPGPELAAFFAATHPEAHALPGCTAGRFHCRQEPDYPWGEPEDEFEADLAAFRQGLGQRGRRHAEFDQRRLPRGRRGHHDAPVQRPGVPRAGTPSSHGSPPPLRATRRSSACGTTTDVRPLLCVDLRCRRACSPYAGRSG